MANKTYDNQAQKITVTVPVALLERLAEYVPARKRSTFIVQAIEDRLAIEEQLAVLEETAGAWSDENHPDLDSVEAVERWICDLRNTWTIPEMMNPESMNNE